MDIARAQIAGSACTCLYDQPGSVRLDNATSVKLITGGPGSISNALLAQFDDINMLAFQGTITEFVGGSESRAIESVLDWIDNLKIESDSLFGCPGLVHKGFGEQFGYVADDVVRAVESLSRRQQDKPLCVTGHSQGGAIAVLATGFLQEKGVVVSETYTFASPLCADEEFIDSILTPVNRFEFGCDIVPHVPLSPAVSKILRENVALWPLSGSVRSVVDSMLAHANVAMDYKSAGVLFYSREYRQAFKEYSDPYRESSLYADRLFRLLFNATRMVEDHRLNHYLDSLV